MKSVITDVELLFASDENATSDNVHNNDHDPITNLTHSSNDRNMFQRMKTRFRRRGDTTTLEGPTGVAGFGSGTMMGAWASAAFGRGDNRKVFKNYFARNSIILLSSI